jgi:hypothetical protein
VPLPLSSDPLNTKVNPRALDYMKFDRKSLIYLADKNYECIKTKEDDLAKNFTRVRRTEKPNFDDYFDL